MKRELSINHLLFNAKKKPTYVSDWLANVQDTLPPYDDRDRDVIERYVWQEFADENKPLIREFDLTNNRPTLFESFCNGIPSVCILVKAWFGFPQEGTRLLNWVSAFVAFDLTQNRYRCNVEDHDDLVSPCVGENIPDMRLTQGDQQALSLLIEAVMKQTAAEIG